MSAPAFKRRLISKHETKHYQGVITLTDLKERFAIPAGATVTVRVPGGGDWSNTDLSLEDVGGIDVTWDERS